jgi:predicted GIY-YIG superfamily endonuclease
MLRMVKDNLGLKVPGVYRIPCERGKVYVGQTGRSTEARCKEHEAHTR